MSYRDKFYERYISTHTGDLYHRPSLADIRGHFVTWESYYGRFLPREKRARILDAGCGDGGFVYWLQERGYENAEGIDVSKEQMERAGKLGIRNVRVADVREFLGRERGKFDLVFARDLLEHFPKDELLELVEIVRESLGEHGAFVAQTVNAGNLFWGRLRHGDFTHETAFTAQSIKQLLKVAGFREINVYPQRPVVHGAKSFIRYVLWWCIEQCSKLFLRIETGTPGDIFTQNLIVEAKQ